MPSALRLKASWEGWRNGSDGIGNTYNNVLEGDNYVTAMERILLVRNAAMDWNAIRREASASEFPSRVELEITAGIIQTGSFSSLADMMDGVQ